MNYHDRITLTYAAVTTSALGAPILGTPSVVAEVWANVRRMSAYKAMMTFQQADVIGLEIEMRQHGLNYNGMRWEGHTLAYGNPDTTDPRVIKVNAYYQIDDPALTPVPPTPESVSGDSI